LREEVDVGRDEQTVAALVRDGADPADQVADRKGRGSAVRCSDVVRLAPQPGIIAFLFGFLLQIEAAPG